MALRLRNNCHADAALKPFEVSRQACEKITQIIVGHAKSGALACSSLSPALQQVYFEDDFSLAEAPGLY
jgi:hypothetical protein